MVHVALVAAIALFSVWSAYLEAREVALRVEERQAPAPTSSSERSMAGPPSDGRDSGPTLPGQGSVGSEATRRLRAGKFIQRTRGAERDGTRSARTSNGAPSGSSKCWPRQAIVDRPLRMPLRETHLGLARRWTLEAAVAAAGRQDSVSRARARDLAAAPRRLGKC
ncbi:hypothetical protein D0N42_06320 [Micrococcus luteus]|nr:hypothetical protein D0N42_06320 [Micrococcus luteus]